MLFCQQYRLNQSYRVQYHHRLVETHPATKKGGLSSTGQEASTMLMYGIPSIANGSAESCLIISSTGVPSPKLSEIVAFRFQGSTREWENFVQIKTYIRVSVSPLAGRIRLITWNRMQRLQRCLGEQYVTDGNLVQLPSAGRVIGRTLTRDKKKTDFAAQPRKKARLAVVSTTKLKAKQKAIWRARIKSPSAFDQSSRRALYWIKNLHTHLPSRTIPYSTVPDHIIPHHTTPYHTTP